MILFSINQNFLKANDTLVKVKVNPEYQAGSLHKLIYGENWRNVWAEEVEFPILDINTFAGGLKPIKLGGGFQTKSLRLLGKNGIEYKFRSLNKFTDKFLEKEFLGTVVDDIVKDMFSTSNPYSFLVVNPILEKFGIFSINSKIYLMPDSPELGEYREMFANVVGTLEVNPDIDENTDKNEYMGADKISNTYKLFKNSKEKANHNIDKIEFLKARLLDVYLGDWDRHYDQWKWLVFKENGISTYKPIPRDRDQAFAKYQGLVGFAVSEFVIQITNYSEDYPDITESTYSGRYLDRRFLNNIDKYTWDSVAVYIQNNLTDSLIEYSLSKLNPEIYKISHEELSFKMKERRNKIKEISDQYYQLLAKETNLYLTDLNDYIELEYLENGNISINSYTIEKSNHFQKINRVFNQNETETINIFMYDGDDYLIAKGNNKSSIEVNVFGGKGADKFVDSTINNNHFLLLFPSKNISFYDEGKKTDFELGESSKKFKYDFKFYANDTLVFENPSRDWGYLWLNTLWFSLNSDDGLFFGFGPVKYKYGIGTDEFSSRNQIQLGYSTRLNGFRLRYNGLWNFPFSNISIYTYLYYASIDVAHFYGIGNSDFYINEKDEKNYRINLSSLNISTSLRYSFNKNIYTSIGINLKRFDLDDYNKSIQTDIDSNLLNGLHYFGINTMVQIDNRKNEMYPQNSVLFTLNSNQTVDIFGTYSKYFKFQSDARYYYNPISDFVLAGRAGFEFTSKNAPFYDLAFLGGQNLRGYKKNRFAEQSNFYASVELRKKIIPFKLIVNGDLGLLAFYDLGKAFKLSDAKIFENTNKSFGTGIFVSFLNDMALFSANYAKSVNDYAIYLNYGFYW